MSEITLTCHNIILTLEVLRYMAKKGLAIQVGGVMKTFLFQINTGNHFFGRVQQTHIFIPDSLKKTNSSNACALCDGGRLASGKGS